MKLYSVTAFLLLFVILGTLHTTGQTKPVIDKVAELTPTVIKDIAKTGVADYSTLNK